MIRTHIVPAILMTIICVIFTGFLFPALIWVLGQTIFPAQANGSLITRNGTQVGSEIIGQNLSALEYFHPRPSAAGAGYDPLASGGTNLGPTSKKLFVGIADDAQTAEVDETYVGVEGLAKAYRELNGLSSSELLPADAVTRSASGLDPHISPRNALLQAARVAQARGLSKEKVQALVGDFVEGRFLGVFGEPRVNVLQLNLALDEGKVQ